MWTRSNWPRSLHSRTTRYKRDKFDFWESVYGFDMTAVRTLALGEPLVDEVYAEQDALEFFATISLSSCPLSSLPATVPEPAPESQHSGRISARDGMTKIILSSRGLCLPTLLSLWHLHWLLLSLAP